ncbi:MULTISPECIES: OmpP1/FadL family transporter [Candidatus Ichthyocystis]|uniref:OmpP1/FadL family transporter n=1 Tax=Candidatus Ichthyocystis TaxID=2929841 RepID=UPI000B89BFBF|nr:MULTISPECIES: outer membrane protein transport protein [Ichthyocystis]
MVSNSKSKFLALVVCFCSPLAVQNVHSSGFALSEQSVSLEGMGVSGVAAADDVGVAFFNPAAVSFLPKSKQREIVVGGQYVILDISFHDLGSKQPSFPVYFPDSVKDGSSRTSAAIPSVSLSIPLSDRYGLIGGFFLGPPFGLATDYGSTWMGRYRATSSKVVSLVFNPFLSIRPTNSLSIGFGLNALYFQSELSQIVNLSEAIGSSLSARVGRSLATLCATPLPSQFNTLQPYVDLVCSERGSARSSFSGSSFALGWNAGAMYQPSNDWRFGLSYRHGYSLRVNGNINIDNFDVDFYVFKWLSPSVGPTSLKGRAGYSYVDLPSVVDFSIFHKFSDSYDIALDIRHFDWLDTKKMSMNDGAGEVLSVKVNARSTWSLNMGGQYHHSDKLTLRGGFVLAQGFSSQDKRTLLPRLPDSNRFGFSGGVSYNVSPDSSLAASVLYIMSTAPSKIFADDNEKSLGVLRGSFDSHAWVLGVQYVRSF